jgi:hypothetical protein
MAQLLGVQEIAAYATEEGPAQGRKRKGEAEAFLGGEPQFLINARKRRATAEAEQLAMLDADGEDAPLPPPKLRPSPKRRAASAGKRRLPSRGRACAAPGSGPSGAAKTAGPQSLQVTRLQGQGRTQSQVNSLSLGMQKRCPACRCGPSSCNCARSPWSGGAATVGGPSCRSQRLAGAFGAQPGPERSVFDRLSDGAALDRNRQGATWRVSAQVTLCSCCTCSVLVECSAPCVRGLCSEGVWCGVVDESQHGNEK